MSYERSCCEFFNRLINIVGNFGTVFVDQAYWQRAIAARPSSTVKAYLLGGLAWFGEYKLFRCELLYQCQTVKLISLFLQLHTAIPFFLATTLGLAAVALESNPIFPTYPNRMAKADVTAGLVAPTAAVALLGSSGAATILILVFMAVTSAASAELVAVSSVW